MIRIVDYLEDLGEDFKSSGKNVGSNDVNIDCPFCGETSKHLGIHKTKGTLHCWVCELDWRNANDEIRYPKFIDLIMVLEGCSYNEAIRILNEYSDEDCDEKPIRFGKVDHTIMPAEMESFYKPDSIYHRDLALGYLKSRNFGWDEIEKYKLGFCSSGNYAMRIIIPVFAAGAIGTFVGRDYADRGYESRYKNCSVEYSLHRPSELLYGMEDFAGPHLRIVEGPTDKWRMEDNNTLATFTAKLSKSQRAWIVSNIKKIKSCSIIYDRDAFGKAQGIAENLSIFLDKIKVIDLGSFKDPDQAGKEVILKLEEQTVWVNF